MVGVVRDFPIDEGSIPVNLLCRYMHNVYWPEANYYHCGFVDLELFVIVIIIDIVILKKGG